MIDDGYELIVAGPAARAIAETLPELVAAAVIDFITGSLLENPRRVGRELRNELAGIRSARRGSYRVLYRVDESQRTVTVLRHSRRTAPERRLRDAPSSGCAKPRNTAIERPSLVMSSPARWPTFSPSLERGTERATGRRCGRTKTPWQ